MIKLYVKKYPFSVGEKDEGHNVAHSLFAEICEKTPGACEKNTKKDENGKPFFTEQSGEVRYYFNISHGKGYAAVLLTDEGECGVDIEPEIPPEGARKIKERFLKDDLSTSKYSGKIFPTLIGFDPDVTVLENTDSKIATVTEKWTTLEAVLKADGRGFTAFKERREIADRVRSTSFKITDGKRVIYLTVAILKVV